MPGWPRCVPWTATSSARRIILGARRAARPPGRWPTARPTGSAAAGRYRCSAYGPPTRVLEIGFGPGVAIGQLVRAGAGHVYGMDHSEVMVREASRRNAAAIRAGRVTLVLASVEQIPPALDGPFDAIIAVNSLGFWPAPAERLAELRQRLAPGGRIAIESQPRCPGATADTTRGAAREIEDLLRGAGFTRLRTETLRLSPPVACVLAVA